MFPIRRHHDWQRSLAAISPSCCPVKAFSVDFLHPVASCAFQQRALPAFRQISPVCRRRCSGFWWIPAARATPSMKTASISISRRKVSKYSIITTVLTVMDVMKFMIQLYIHSVHGCENDPGPFYWHELTDIRARSDNFIHGFMCYATTHPCTNLNGGLPIPPMKLQHRWVIIYLVYKDVITYPCPNSHGLASFSFGLHFMKCIFWSNNFKSMYVSCHWSFKPNWRNELRILACLYLHIDI